MAKRNHVHVCGAGQEQIFAVSKLALIDETLAAHR